jgi:hypothetical protein
MFHKRREANLATHYTLYNPLSGCTSPVNYAGLPVLGATCPNLPEIQYASATSPTSPNYITHGIFLPVVTTSLSHFS